MHLVIFDCRQQKYFGAKTIDYAIDGRIINTLDTNALLNDMKAKGLNIGETFSEIYPGTLIESLMEIVCK